jgi:cytochrome b
MAEGPLPQSGKCGSETGTLRRALIRVWDLPTRLFHWVLVLLVAVNIVTGNIGGLREMQWHEWSGLMILALVLFRLLWGLVGSRRSRFADFVRGPRAVIVYAHGLLTGRHTASIGHNPLGGWSVMAMVLCLLLQAATGMFANDDILTEGPLARKVSPAISDLLTEVHEINASVLYLLITVHLAAVLYYTVVHKEALLRAMIIGRKEIAASRPGEDAPFVSLGRAIASLMICGAAVWAIVSF